MDDSEKLTSRSTAIRGFGCVHWTALVIIYYSKLRPRGFEIFQLWGPAGYLIPSLLSEKGKHFCLPNLLYEYLILNTGRSTLSR